jgi:amino acid adenylation domain-containing protein
LFEEQVAKKADQAAVVHNHQSLGYRELNERANQLAGVLRENRVKSDSAVAIMIEPSLEMIVGILGILKAGGAYLPIDPGYPGKRIVYMTKDSNTMLLLTTASLAAKADIGVPTILLEDKTNYRASISGPTSVNGPGDLAYVIYTSGSTGEPKGVLVEHRSVVRLVKNTNYIQFKPDDRILQTGALEFDASTFEIWGALLNGLPLYLVDRQELLNIQTFKQALQKHEITTMWLTAPFFNQLLMSDSELFAGLRNLLVGGDILNPYCIAAVKAKFPDLNVINGYGPTENTTFSTTYLIDGENKDSIPIGKPIANSTVYIVDQYDCLMPIGVAGQLCTGGDGIARGYLNNPQLTWEKFPQNSFLQGKNSTGTGARLYRTGDRARWLPDGNIEFLGRMDFQAKIRGFRIEPAEIERQLLEHQDVKECVVGIRENENGEKYLCAYVVPEEALDVPRLKEYLAQELPVYMVPQHFVQLEKMPLTANGKIARNVLNTLDPVQGSSVEYVPPKTQLENTIARIWQEVLGVGNIGVHDNFFEVGGDSLKIVKLSSKLKNTLDKDFPLTTLFRYPTIASFAQYMEEGEESSDILSDEEIDESLYKMEDAMQMFTGAEND